MIEEICERLTLKELDEIFDEILFQYDQRQDEMGKDCIPAYHPIDIHYSLKSIATELNVTDKHTIYNASLLKKCLRLYKKSYLVADNERVPHIQSAIKQEDLPDFDEIF